jgi:hypothetical protein
MSDRTTIRRAFPFQSLIALGILLPILISCAPKNPNSSDPWSLTPPVLVTASDSRPLLSLKFDKLEKLRNEKAVSESLELPLSSHIVFAPSDRGLKFDFVSQCENQRHSGQAQTSGSVSISALLPPSILHDSLIRKVQRPSCSVSIIVVSSEGSTHSFTLAPFKFNPLGEELTRVLPLDALSNFSQSRTQIKMVCGAWWSAETPVQATSGLSFKRRLEALANGPVVGEDDRAKRWNPDCGIFLFDSDLRETYLGRTRPLESIMRLSIEERFEWNPGRAAIFAQGTFASWTITNISNFPTAIRVPLSSTKVRLRASHLDRDFGMAPKAWQRSAVLDITQGATGLKSQNVKIGNQAGYYLIEPKASLVISLNISSQAFCQLPIPGVIQAKLNRPLSFELLDGGIPLGEFLSLSLNQLESVNSARNYVLIDSADLFFDHGHTSLSRILLTRAAEEGTSTAGSPTCLAGSIFGGSSPLPE